MRAITEREPTVHKLFDLTGKTSLITGGAGHLGLAMSRALAEAGSSVVLTSRNAACARHAATHLPRSATARHHGVALDYLDPASIERGFAEAVSVAGQLDVLVNNGHVDVPNDWTTITADQFNRQLANSTGYFLLARLMRRHVVERGSPASIVMLGSMYGQVASYPDVYEGICDASPVAYHALKGGIIHMTRHLAAYWAGDRVRVNCLSPGPFPGPKAPQALVERLCTKLPMKRMGQAWELKGATIFLASDASSFMTGQNLVIDGGWTSW